MSTDIDKQIYKSYMKEFFQVLPFMLPVIVLVTAPIWWPLFTKDEKALETANKLKAVFYGLAPIALAVLTIWNRKRQ